MASQKQTSLASVPSWVFTCAFWITSRVWCIFMHCQYIGDVSAYDKIWLRSHRIATLEIWGILEDYRATRPVREHICSVLLKIIFCFVAVRWFSQIVTSFGEKATFKMSIFGVDLERFHERWENPYGLVLRNVLFCIAFPEACGSSFRIVALFTCGWFCFWYISFRSQSLQRKTFYTDRG